MPPTPQLIVPPDALTKPCYVAPPPADDLVINALDHYPQASGPWEARTLLMVDRWMEQTQELGNCNKQLSALRGWYQRQQNVEGGE